MSPRTYLVTGGTGFLGSALVKHLVRSGHAVRVLDNQSRGVTSRLDEVRDRIAFVEADVRDANAVKACSAGVDVICHLAFVNGTEYFYSNPELVLDVGVKGIVNVLDACRANDIRELILVSSSEVYQTPPRVPTPESVPLIIPDPHNPRFSYAAGKIISEIMALNYGRTGFDRVAIVRPHNVYGPDMGFEHVIPQLAMRLASVIASDPTCEGPTQLPIQGTGRETRAFVYIDDFIAGLMLVVECGEHLGIYHVGTDEEVTIEFLAREIGRVFDREVQIVPGESLLGATPRRCPDISRLMALGYQPAVPLREGIRTATRWYANYYAEHKHPEK